MRREVAFLLLALSGAAACRTRADLPFGSAGPAPVSALSVSGEKGGVAASWPVAAGAAAIHVEAHLGSCGGALVVGTDLGAAATVAHLAVGTALEPVCVSVQSEDAQARRSAAVTATATVFPIASAGLLPSATPVPVATFTANTLFLAHALTLDANADGRADVLVAAGFYDAAGSGSCGSCSGLLRLLLSTTSGGFSQAGADVTNAADTFKFLGVGAAVAGATRIAAGTSVNGDPFNGSVRVFDVSAAGISPAQQKIEGCATCSGSFGFTMASLVGLGHGSDASLAVGAFTFNNNSSRRGRVRVLKPTVTGYDASTDIGFTWPASTPVGAGWTRPIAAGDFLGCDGHPDIAAGSVNSNGVMVFAGPFASAVTPGFFTSRLPGEDFGRALANGGPVRGDGCDHLLVGSPKYPVSGSASGKVTLFEAPLPTGVTGTEWTFTLGTANAQLGATLDGNVDINGDGYADVVVGAPGLSHGGAYLFLGGPHGLEPSFRWAWATTAANVATGAVLAHGDVDGDGSPDLLVGSSGAGGDRLDVFYGPPSTGPVVKAPVIAVAGGQASVTPVFTDAARSGPWVCSVVWDGGPPDHAASCAPGNASVVSSPLASGHHSVRVTITDARTLSTEAVAGFDVP